MPCRRWLADEALSAHRQWRSPALVRAVGATRLHYLVSGIPLPPALRGSLVALAQHARMNEDARRRRVVATE